MPQVWFQGVQPIKSKAISDCFMTKGVDCETKKLHMIGIS